MHKIYKFARKQCLTYFVHIRVINEKEKIIHFIKICTVSRKKLKNLHLASN